MRQVVVGRRGGGRVLLLLAVAVLLYVTHQGAVDGRVRVRRSSAQANIQAFSRECAL